MYLDNRVGALGRRESVLYVNDKPYPAVLVNFHIHSSHLANKAGDKTPLDVVVLDSYPEYIVENVTIYALPEIDTPQPDRNKIPPDIVRIPYTPDKDRVPLRTPWNPDKIPKKRGPTKKKRDPFGIVN